MTIISEKLVNFTHLKKIKIFTTMKKLLYFFVLILTNSLFGQEYKSSVNAYLNANKSELGIESQDYDDLIIDRHSYSKSMDVENVYAIQRYQGIEVFNSVSSFAIRNGQVLNAGFSFKKNISEKVNTTSPSISAATAINNAAQSLGLITPSNIELIETFLIINSYFLMEEFL